MLLAPINSIYTYAKHWTDQMDINSIQRYFHWSSTDTINNITCKLNAMTCVLPHFWCDKGISLKDEKVLNYLWMCWIYLHTLHIIAIITSKSNVTFNNIVVFYIYNFHVQKKGRAKRSFSNGPSVKWVRNVKCLQFSQPWYKEHNTLQAKSLHMNQGHLWAEPLTKLNWIELNRIKWWTEERDTER